ncbi:MAG: ATP phosphoribosyltransferase regulatory subunit [Oscillospiraceae bacterium]|nr:ATP phosphoribosyltransferase regulatory subunit [Oscillospiraceae bacterium]
MKTLNKWVILIKRYDLLTPEGTRDLLFEESIARRYVEQKLQRLFSAFGYSEVITSGLEYYDVFCSKKRYFPPENIYKLTDSKGRLIVFRPDSTLPIARLVSSRLKDSQLPLKLYYSQNIFRINPKDSGRDDEIAQSGIEIIGGENPFCDFEALALTVEVLKCLNIRDFHLEIGDCGFFKLLISQLALSDEQVENIRVLIENKNCHELSELLQKEHTCPWVMKEFSRLSGGREVFDRARALFAGCGTSNKTVHMLMGLLEKLTLLYDNLTMLTGGKNIGVDLSAVSKIDYYTGLLFKVYIPGYGMPFISGGRYDTLLGDFGRELPAIGFAVNVSAAADALQRQGSQPHVVQPDVLIHNESGDLSRSIERANELIKSGKKIELSLYSDLRQSEEYAKTKGIRKVEKV